MITRQSSEYIPCRCCQNPHQSQQTDSSDLHQLPLVRQSPESVKLLNFSHLGHCLKSGIMTFMKNVWFYPSFTWAQHKAMHIECKEESKRNSSIKVWARWMLHLSCTSRCDKGFCQLCSICVCAAACPALRCSVSLLPNIGPNCFHIPFLCNTGYPIVISRLQTKLDFMTCLSVCQKTDVYNWMNNICSVTSSLDRDGV
jgi:hypothetical protein